MDDIGLSKEPHLYRIISDTKARRGDLESDELLQRENENTLDMKAHSFEKRI